MATLVAITRVSSPKSRRRGSDAPEYESMWRVEVDDFVPGARVIELGQESASADRIPRRGESLRWVSSGETFRDPSVFALDFRSDQIFKKGQAADPKHWWVTVTWRAPKPGDDEQPDTITLPPTQRPPEYWIEYNTVDRTFTTGYVVDSMTVQYLSGTTNTQLFAENQLHSLMNAVGEKFTVDGVQTEMIIVKQHNVLTDSVGIRLNQKFESTTNSDVWRVRGVTVQPHFGRFVRAETGTQQTEENWEFYRMQTRVAISRIPYYDTRAHTGRKFTNSTAGHEKFQTTDGFIEDEGAIARNKGQKPSVIGTHEETLRWLLHEPVIYSTGLRFQ